MSFRHVINTYQSTVRNISDDLNQKLHFSAGLDINLYKLSIANTAVPLGLENQMFQSLPRNIHFLGKYLVDL
jgi:hypothetical protein